MITAIISLVLRLARAWEQWQVEAGAGGTAHPACPAQVFVHLPLYPTAGTKIRAEIPTPHFHQLKPW